MSHNVVESRPNLSRSLDAPGMRGSFQKMIPSAPLSLIPLRNRIATTLAVFALAIGPSLSAAEVHLGSGAMAGEITDRTAIIQARLTSAPGQDAGGLIPGTAGDVRLFYDTSGSFARPTITPWRMPSTLPRDTP
jgi:hypothetical protein